MNTVKSLIFAQDLNKLNNSFLQEICEEMGLQSTGLSNELTIRIWNAFSTISAETLKKIESSIFTGATSLAWYKTTNESKLIDLKNTLINKLSFNPFEEIHLPDNGVDNDPVIIGAADIENKNAYYLRLMYKASVNVDFYMSDARQHVKHDIITVYIDVDKDIVEVRGSSKIAKKIVQSLANILDGEFEFKQFDFLEAFDNKLERIADELGGQLIDAIGRPNGIVDDFDEQKGEAVVSILSAIDEYYNIGELSVLQESLNNEEIREVLETTPFTLVLLSGLETVGLGSIRELRGLPLYDYLEKYLKKQKGSILFEHSVSGVVEEYSIRIGVKTKTFKFNVSAPENVLQYVRSKLI